jgi:hypothetical protein
MSLGIGGNMWSDKLAYDLVDRGLINPPDGGYFFGQTSVSITEEGARRAIELINETGARVPESILFRWRYNYVDNRDDEPRFTAIPPNRLPQSLIDRMAELEPLYENFIGQIDEARSLRERDSGVADTVHDSRAWTGAQRVYRIEIIKALVPSAMDALNGLIRQLETPGHNGGPPLEDVNEMLACLRQLHSALGRLLAAADGDAEADIFDGAITAVQRFATRFANMVRDDPVKYGLATLIGVSAGIGLIPAPIAAVGVASVMRVDR